MKNIDHNRTTKVECLAHAVAPIGFEKLVEVALDGPVGKQKREGLARLKISKRILKHEADFPDSPGFQGGKLTKAVHQLQRAFGEDCMHAIKQEDSKVFQQEVKQNRKLSLFLLGGGRSVQFYRDIINDMYEGMKNNNDIPDKVETDILKYLKENERFEIQNNHRLIVSQMLAQPFDLIPELDDNRWILSPKKHPSSPGSHPRYIPPPDNDYLLADD